MAVETARAKHPLTVCARAGATPQYRVLFCEGFRSHITSLICRGSRVQILAGKYLANDSGRSLRKNVFGRCLLMQYPRKNNNRPNYPVFSTRFLISKHRDMRRRHAISPRFSGRYQDQGISSLEMRDSACVLILAINCSAYGAIRILCNPRVIA